jgi:hypothetical protein
MDERLATFLLETVRAKRSAADLYLACRNRTSRIDARAALQDIAADETRHALSLAKLVRPSAAPVLAVPPRPVTPGCGLGDESWPSALMTVFALDQAATGALHALALAAEAELASVARRVAEEERAHQSFAVGSFHGIADRDPEFGRRLAREMIEARDWIKEAYPRRRTLDALVQAGVLPSEAPKAHDTFLASLGDRIQEALGVLGY